MSFPSEVEALGSNTVLRALSVRVGAGGGGNRKIIWDDPMDKLDTTYCPAGCNGEDCKRLMDIGKVNDDTQGRNAVEPQSFVSDDLVTQVLRLVAIFDDASMTKKEKIAVVTLLAYFKRRQQKEGRM